MQSRNKAAIGLIGTGLGYFLNASIAHAFCPICTIAVGGTLVLLERFGVDNTVSGLWIGALSLSMIYWTNDWLKARRYYTKLIGLLVHLFYYGSIIIPLWMTGIIGQPEKRIWGIDKVIVGMALGSILFFGGVWLADVIKKNNNNKVYFPFQKIVISLVPLIILSIIFFLATRTI